MGVECINGKAKIISPYAVQVNDKIYTAKKMVIATGAKPYIPNIKGLDHSKILHYENIPHLEELLVLTDFNEVSENMKKFNVERRKKII